MVAILWLLLHGAASFAGKHEWRIAPETQLSFLAQVRGYYMNDQRIDWSGVEASFGCEATLLTDVDKKLSWGRVGAEGEFYLNQRFGKNLLTDEHRKKYAANFEVEQFSISQLNVRIGAGPATFIMGKNETPFGRAYFPNFLNNRNFDSPFIRSEAILWRETGFFIAIRSGILSADLAICNGEEDRDTNSSASPIGRFGVGTENWAVGASVKVGDGIGSARQKTYKRHYGLDAMARFGAFQLSGEFIYDEYGLVNNIGDDEIVWPRSLYYRDIFYRRDEPIAGRGGYVNFNYSHKGWLANFNYGVYHPEQVGNAFHDEPNRRAIASVFIPVLDDLNAFGAVVIENKREHDSWMATVGEWAYVAGLQFSP